jgi:hypothetical protein
MQTQSELRAGPAREGSARAALAGHRNLYNGDCNTYFYNPEIWQPEGGAYSARAIQRFVDRLADGGIDTFLINPNTQVVWYPSRKLESALAGYRRGDRDFLRAHAVGLALEGALLERYFEEMERLYGVILDLREGGVDWLAETAAACRRRGIAPWLSFRMNDTHGAGNPEASINCKLYREARFRLSGRVPGTSGRREPSWIGLDYELPEVRRYMLELIREPVEDYDFDGIELDWLRHPVCCEPVAGARQIELMSAWIGEVRALATARARTSGRGCPLGLRVPGSLGYMRSIGIDVAALARSGAIDFVAFSNFWQTTWDMPHDQLRAELGPDVAIYGVMEDAPNWLETVAPGLRSRSAYQELQLHGDDAFGGSKPEAKPAARVRGTRYLSASAELLRGNAAGKLVLGADGIEQFNFYVTDQVRVPGQRADYDALRGLADLGALRGKPKHYTLGTPSGRGTAYWDIPEQLPVRVASGERRTLRLPMCTEPAGSGLRLVAQVVSRRPAAGAAAPLGVSLNGAWPAFDRKETEALLFPAGPYAAHVPEHQAFDYVLDPAGLRDGWNELTLVAGLEPAEPVEVVSLEVGLLPADAPVAAG